MLPEEVVEIFTLPEGCPIPGAVYRRKLPSGHWEFATITGLQTLTMGRWSAVFSSVRYGDERITSEINKLSKFQLHSTPNMTSVPTTKVEVESEVEFDSMAPQSLGKRTGEPSTNGVSDDSIDELDSLLAFGA